MGELETLLTASEVAKLETVSYEKIKKDIRCGKIKAIKNSVSGRKGFEYRISLDQLSDMAKRRYYAQQKNIAISENKEEQYKNMTVENLSDKQREEIEFWKKVIRSWQAFINEYPKQKTEKTNEFVKM